MACSSFAQLKDVAVLGVGNFTAPAVGQNIHGNSTGMQYTQSSRASAGLSIGYSHWWGNNAPFVTYAITPTDSQLLSKAGVHQHWTVTRHEFDVGWMHRLRIGRTSPYVLGGFGAILLNGGSASGLDRQFAIVVGAGNDVRISSRLALRYGMKVDFLRASNFSDSTYRGGRTFMLQPTLGLIWTMGSGRERPTIASAKP